MIVRWSTRARDDLVRIKTYIAEHDPLASVRVSASLIGVSELLAANPRIGPEFGPNRRKFSRPPYVVLYRVERNHIIITRIYHARQDWR